MASIYTHRNFYTDSFTHREAFKHSKLLQTKAFTHSKLLQKKFLRRETTGIAAPKPDLGAKAKKR